MNFNKFFRFLCLIGIAVLHSCYFCLKRILCLRSLIFGTGFNSIPFRFDSTKLGFRYWISTVVLQNWILINIHCMQILLLAYNANFPHCKFNCIHEHNWSALTQYHTNRTIHFDSQCNFNAFRFKMNCEHDPFFFKVFSFEL